MLVLLPLIVIAVYLGLYLMRSGRTADCRWRQTGRDAEGIDWACPVCGGSTRTEKGEPRFCAAKPAP
ncbi:hypothetical protein [Celeribacter indicus]|uniref:Uncharacterized protein n=1 Tax=Celeribacter indicus TaxID=1208324 RepID=A0A0B5DYR2_9RHOB|nr:hypothetical protein [Celeribacter indicus]AJE48573.1 hypothetical protein P73_3858 [Celeribacter indicus]SDX08772.1 hypothetical protein SAMN05443573_11365 [Celeribacter indicus]